MALYRQIKRISVKAVTPPVTRVKQSNWRRGKEREREGKGLRGHNKIDKRERESAEGLRLATYLLCAHRCEGANCSETKHGALGGGDVFSYNQSAEVLVMLQWWAEQYFVFPVDQIYWIWTLEVHKPEPLLWPHDSAPHRTRPTCSGLSSSTSFGAKTQNIHRAWGFSSNEGTYLWFDANRWIQSTIKIKQNNSFLLLSLSGLSDRM